MNPKVSKMLDKIHPDIRLMSEAEGCDFIVWLLHRNIDLKKLISYPFSKQLDLLNLFRQNSIKKE